MEENYENFDRRLLLLRSDSRKRKVETLILKQFFTLGKGIAHPKKEYIRCRVIRGHKKLIRNILLRKNSKKGITCYDAKNRRELQNYRIFEDQLNENMGELDALSQTDSGPLTDGKRKREKKDTEEIKEIKEKENSFNNAFCLKYFSSVAVRESFVHFMELVFSNFNPDILIGKFGFRCCKHKLHLLECFEKWNTLKFYLQEEIFITLECEVPNISFQNNNTLPDISQVINLIDFQEKKIDCFEIKNEAALIIKNSSVVTNEDKIKIEEIEYNR